MSKGTGYNYDDDDYEDYTDDESSYDDESNLSRSSSNSKLSNHNMYPLDEEEKQPEASEKGMGAVLEFLCEQNQIDLLENILKTINRNERCELLKNSNALKLAKNEKIVEILLDDLGAKQRKNLLYDQDKENIISNNQFVRAYINKIPVKKGSELSYHNLEEILDENHTKENLKKYNEFFTNLGKEEKKNLLLSNDWLITAVAYKDNDLVTSMLKNLDNNDKELLLEKKPHNPDLRPILSSIEDKEIIATILDGFHWNELNRLLHPENNFEPVFENKAKNIDEYEKTRLKKEFEKIKEGRDLEYCKDYFIKLRSDFKYELLKNNQDWLDAANQYGRSDLANAMLKGLPNDQKKYLLERNNPKNKQSIHISELDLNKLDEKKIFKEVGLSFKDLENKISSKNNNMKAYIDFFSLLNPQDKKKILKENDWLTLAVINNEKQLFNDMLEGFNNSEKMELLQQTPIHKNKLTPILSVNNIDIIKPTLEKYHLIDLNKLLYPQHLLEFKTINDNQVLKKYHKARTINEIDSIYNRFSDEDLLKYRGYFSNLRIDLKYEFLKESKEWLRFAVNSGDINLIKAMLKDIPKDQKTKLLKESNALSYAKNEAVLELLMQDLTLKNKEYLLITDPKNNDPMSDPIANALEGRRTELARILLGDDAIRKKTLLNLLDDERVKIDNVVEYFTFMSKSERKELILRKQHESNDKETKIKCSLLLEVENRPILRKMLTAYKYNQSPIEENIGGIKSYINKISDIFAKLVLGRATDRELFEGMIKASDSNFIFNAAAAIEERGYSKEVKVRPKLKKLISTKNLDEISKEDVKEIVKSLNNSFASLAPGRDTDLELLKKLSLAKGNKFLAGDIENIENENLIKQRSKLKKLLDNEDKNLEDVLTIKNKIGNLFANFVPGRETDMQILKKIKETKDKSRKN